ncbi:intein splicing region [Dictyocaulus viviparus]|uniref:Intein splicing region n=1 Tax=Dictyocaulus viviparus TaxID=29172 RepID=A0A0D8XDV1_DICVI|nr:intein splicing region [Dictyocaulus viviparus]
MTFHLLKFEACFSTDTWVTVPDGKKRMDQLKVGDFVLTANLTTVYYTPITLWIHREPNVMTKFVTIMTDYGKMLALTPRHLMFRYECDDRNFTFSKDLIRRASGTNTRMNVFNPDAKKENRPDEAFFFVLDAYEHRIDVLPPNSQAVYAEELKVGDCIYLLYKGSFRLQKLQDISITSRRGIFSPLTSNGRIIVNDMLASCYSDINESTLQNTYFYDKVIHSKE